MATSVAHALIIDDEDQSVFASEISDRGVKAKWLPPSDVEKSDVAIADVVLVDFKLDVWPEREKVPFSLKPRDGLALCALLRRQVHDDKRNSPTAFAIRTGQMATLASPLPPESRNHLLAQLNNLEWVFDKSQYKNALDQIVCLANGLKALPEKWPLEDVDEIQKVAFDLMDLNADDPELVGDFLRCRPPLYSLSSWSHGLAFVRWLLHRVFPYPCFLLDDIHVASRLRINLSTLQRIADSSKGPLAGLTYTGVMAGFAGRRWWRQQIEQTVWAATQGNSLDGDAIRNWLASKSSVLVEKSVSDEYPVVCLDASHQSLPDVYPVEECVRIQPDDWPAYADQAWTTVKLASSDEKLGRLVRPEDRQKLDRHES